MGSRRFHLFAILIVAGAVAACGDLSPADDDAPGLAASSAGPPDGQGQGVTRESLAPASIPTEGAAESGIKPEILKGTGRFINRAAASRPPVQVTPRGNVILNFAGASIGEVVRSVLGTTLKLNYILHPKVKGTVTVQTSRPLPRAAVLPALENILRVHGAVLVESKGVYQVLPLDEATSGAVRPRLSRRKTPPGRGYGVDIVPLNFVGAVEMEQILKPFAPPKGILRVDRTRNLLLLAGTREELANMVDIVEIFDVDWLSGMSIGLFPLRYSEASALLADLEKVFGSQADGPLAGAMRFVPIERLNAILVISPQPAYLNTAKSWIERFDQGAETGERRLHVYRVQNGLALDLAEVLGKIFDTGESKLQPAPPRLAPGRVPTEIRTRAEASRTTQSARQRRQTRSRLAQRRTGGTSSASGSSTGARAPSTTRPRASRSTATTAPLTPSDVGNIRIIADEQKNALVILSTPRDYRMISAAIRQLDVPPLQVLIEATIAEVTLTDELRYGLQWFFQSGNNTFALSNVASGAVASTFPGFSYVLSGGDARVVLDALASITDVNIISSPQLMVLDNHSAELQVGDEVPVTTQQTSSVADPDAPLVSTIQFRDTGVILRVLPRVNEGGLITMEIEQEVSRVVTSTAGGTLTPTISQRRIRSTVAVQSGETVALGGLIQDSKEKVKAGIPFLSAIPILGALFGTTRDDTNRTELLVMITPRIIRNRSEARAVTEELRRRIKMVVPLMQRVR